MARDAHEEYEDKSAAHRRWAKKLRHYECTECTHRWSLSPEQHLKIMRMTPTCPECGGLDVLETTP